MHRILYYRYIYSGTIMIKTRKILVMRTILKNRTNFEESDKDEDDQDDDDEVEDD